MALPVHGDPELQRSALHHLRQPRARHGRRQRRLLRPGRLRQRRGGQPARAPKVPGKPGAGRPASGKCICCGAPTKGGRFLPGHDAKWLSVQVACFTEGGQDRAEIRDYMRGRGASDALIAKFEKRVGL